MRRGINLAAPPESLTDTRNWYAMLGAPPVYTEGDLGMIHTDARRMLSGVESLGSPPPGRKRATLTPGPATTHVAVVEADLVPVVQGLELYRLRTKPHLYDERHVDTALAQWQTVARNSGTLLADCHRCKITHAVTADTDDCPTCGTEF